MKYFNIHFFLIDTTSEGFILKDKMNADGLLGTLKVKNF